MQDKCTQSHRRHIGTETHRYDNSIIPLSSSAPPPLTDAFYVSETEDDMGQTAEENVIEAESDSEWESDLISN